MDKDTLIYYFLNLPVSINNLYGDPFFKEQEENTFEKLYELHKSKHIGIVSIITKSEINEKIAMRLGYYTKHLKLVVLLSISELPKRIEGVAGNRYNTISLCRKYGIPVLPYIRPFIPGENTNEEAIKKIFSELSKRFEGNRYSIVISGLRGNESILKKFELTQEYNLRVKIIPKDIRELIIKYSTEYNAQVFERTSCGVAYILRLDKSWNPYYQAPKLSGCNSCPLKSSCYDKQFTFKPTKSDLELVHLLGYKGKIVESDKEHSMCSVDGANRTKCESCCTACFKLSRPAIEIEHFDDICLGDLSLLRHLIGKLVYCKGVAETGKEDIAVPKSEVLQRLGIEMYELNTWMSLSRNTSKCYGCSYCIVPHYNNQNREYSDIPRNIDEKISRGINL